MGENVVRVSVGNRVRKTLSFTYFLEQPRDGVKFWMVSGNKRSAHISPFLSVEKCDRLMPRTSTIGRFIRFSQMKSSFPLYHPSMICDNGASQRGKGLHWHFRRLTQQLAWHYRRYGREGGIFLLDLKSFFPNANRDIIYRRHQQVMFDPQIRAVADAIIDYAPYGNAPGRGMPLGVEPSQQEMVSLPSAIDNYIKCQLGLHCAGHYMDDYYVIYHDIEELKQIARDIVKKFESFGIRVNKKKCKIIPLTKPFRFCKARFTLTETGAIKINGSRDGVKRARRKLKMFHREYLAGRKTLFEIDQYMECQTAYYRNFDDHGRLLRLRRLHYAMFSRYREQEQLKKSA